jgi:hypothetical protein
MRIATYVDRVVLLVFFCIVGVGIPLDASSQLAKIRPDHSYYSDELAEPTNQGLVRAIGAEKNYEEIYQFYTYYEVVYDGGGRVVLFREYKRGEVTRIEKYRYDDSGSLVMRVVSQPGEEDEATMIDIGSAPEPEQRSN